MKLKIIFNQRLIAVLLLGFSAGLPLALTGSTLQAWFTESGTDLITIGTLSLLGIPYTLKFLWAPLMDYYRLPWAGKRQGWILLTQLCLVGVIGFLATMDPIQEATQMGLVALALAFLSASQDAAIDAYRTDVLQSAERGLGSAYYIFAYRLAMLLSGGLALILADYVGWKLTYQLMAGLMLLFMIPAYLAPRPAEIQSQSLHFYNSIVSSFKDLLKRDNVVLLAFFIIFYKVGDALALSLMTNFLLHGLGFTLTEVGVAYKLVSFVATIAGAFVGGLFLVRWNIYRALMVFGLAQAFSNLMFVMLAIAGKNFALMAASIFIENFCSGLSTAAFMAFLMSLCNKQYTAGQYALMSAVASLGRVFLGPVAAMMVKELGWVQFYIWAFVLCAPGLVILFFLKERVLSYAHAIVR